MDHNIVCKYCMCAHAHVREWVFLLLFCLFFQKHLYFTGVYFNSFLTHLKADTLKDVTCSHTRALKSLGPIQCCVQAETSGSIDRL